MRMSSIIDKGRRVRVTENGNFHGEEGTVEKIWWDKRPIEISVKLDDLERNIVFFRTDLVMLPATQTKLVEGEEIALKDVKIGMEIKVTYTSGSDGYIQTSTKQGVVAAIAKDGDTGNNIKLYAKVGKLHELLSFHIDKEVFTLIKDAPKVDEIAVALKEAKIGSVVQVQDGGAGCFILTYVKTYAATNGTSRWMALDSRYTTASLVGENTVRSKIQTLDQLVIKH